MSAPRDDLYTVLAMLGEIDRVLSPLPLSPSDDVSAPPNIPPPLPPAGPGRGPRSGGAPPSATGRRGAAARAESPTLDAPRSPRARAAARHDAQTGRAVASPAHSDEAPRTDVPAVRNPDDAPRTQDARPAEQRGPTPVLSAVATRLDDDRPAPPTVRKADGPLPLPRRQPQRDVNVPSPARRRSTVAAAPPPVAQRRRRSQVAPPVHDLPRVAPPSVEPAAAAPAPALPPVGVLDAPRVRSRGSRPEPAAPRAPARRARRASSVEQPIDPTIAPIDDAPAAPVLPTPQRPHLASPARRPLQSSHEPIRSTRHRLPAHVASLVAPPLPQARHPVPPAAAPPPTPAEVAAQLDAALDRDPFDVDDQIVDDDRTGTIATEPRPLLLRGGRTMIASPFISTSEVHARLASRLWARRRGRRL